MEKNLIDSILAPSGISVKPSDLQFKDFLARVKTLNKDTINKLLHERLISFEQNQDPKPIQVSRIILLIFKEMFICHRVFNK